MIVILPDDVDVDSLFDAEVQRRFRTLDRPDPRAAKSVYNRQYRLGIRRPIRRKPLAVRLITKTDRRYGDVPEDRPELGPCWPWVGALNADGYGVIRDDRHDDGSQPLVLAHRASLALALGRPIADGMFANHHCDNSRCVRPKHLYEGTATENVGDMIARRRYRGCAAVPGQDDEEAPIAI